MSPFIPTVANTIVLACQGLAHDWRGCTTVQHHDLHHRCPSKHFSLYFTHWDRWCGTQHPRYDAALFKYYPARTSRCEAAQSSQAYQKGSSAQERAGKSVLDTPASLSSRSNGLLHVSTLQYVHSK